MAKLVAKNRDVRKAVAKLVAKNRNVRKAVAKLVAKNRAVRKAVAKLVAKKRSIVRTVRSAHNDFRVPGAHGTRCCLPRISSPSDPQFVQ